MKKTFKDFLAESERTYEFRIKVAGDFDEDKLPKLENAFEKFGVINVTKPNRTPVQEHPQDFPPEIINREVHMFDVEFAYPSTPQELSVIVSEVMCVSEGHVVVMDRYSHAELEREEHIANTKKSKKYKPLLQSDYEKTPGKPPYGNDYNKKMLKAHKTAKFKSAAGEGMKDNPYETSPGNTKSPIGS